jgi:multiple sugar transport system substrate-binding protein
LSDGAAPPLLSKNGGKSQENAKSRTAVQLKLLVVDDDAMATAINSLKGEWSAETGGGLEIRTATSAELANSKSLAEDAVIYPASALGALAERELIEALPETAPSDLAWSDLFESLQLREAMWGGKRYAVPFGSPVFVLWYRPDLLKQVHRLEPPKTWTEYQQLAQLLSDRANLGEAAPPADVPWTGALEPHAAGWGGRLLLARAAAYALHRDSYSTYFSIDKLRPLIASEPFSRALTELVATSKLAPKDIATVDPAQARREFLAGHAAMVLSWPSSADRASTPTDKAATEATSGETPKLEFAELPGSEMVFNRPNKRWDRRGQGEDPRQTLLGLAGRLGSISAASSYPAESFRLLAWLSNTWGVRVSAASSYTTLARGSQLAKPELWVDAGIDVSAARQYAKVLESSLSRPRTTLLAPRILGESDYMAALDEAVRAAVEDGVRPEKALEQAAAQWDEITQRVGLDAQRAAYRRSLGLEP